MHAASVHPEPGSNSRNHCIKTSLAGWSNLLSSLALSFFYFCLSSILIQRIVRDPFRTYLYALYFSLVVQFSKISAASARDLVIISLPALLVNTFLKSFFNFFQKVFSSLGLSVISLPASSRWACLFYHFHVGLSSVFFDFLSRFFVFGWLPSFIRQITRHCR